MSKYEELVITPAPLPSTSDLKSSIIAKTEHMPQFLEDTRVPEKLSVNIRKTRFWWPQLALPLAAFCILAVITVISPVKWTEVETELNDTMASNDVSEWQDIMLLEDEWLIADL